MPNLQRRTLRTFASRARRRAGLSSFQIPAQVVLPGPNVFKSSAPRILVRVVPNTYKRGLGDNVLNTWGNALGTTYGSLFGIDPATGDFSLLAPVNTAYDMATGLIDPNQLGQITAADYAANLQAATNPITGVVNQQLLNQANAESAAGVGPAADVSNTSTGSYLANVVDSLTGTYTGSLGLPGSTAPLGTMSVSGADGSTPAWVNLLEDLAIALGAGLVVYLGIKLVEKVF